uniref:Uncharacterized protein n=1 Tax=Utricularia reniformis TaxID=192314 RepID=A0A1Y0B0X8_9LAMI|nr:hypothetical protein AEK19_MT0873 [Utricularia reniformis]ART31105.1 hypothetical protein AEK19_MT0873 [Utricularia reniformis]
MVPLILFYHSFKSFRFLLQVRGNLSRLTDKGWLIPEPKDCAPRIP